MKHSNFKKAAGLALFFMAISASLCVFPIMSFGAGGEGAQYPLSIDVSPNIINIESERYGEIRILTDMRYSFYATSGHCIFVYFNESDSVENVRATRDSLGNLIVKFALEDLLVQESWLKPNDANVVKVVVSMDNGDEYMGHGEVYISIKRDDSYTVLKSL